MKEVENIAGNAYKVKIKSVENVQKMRKILRKIYHYDNAYEDEEADEFDGLLRTHEHKPPC